MGVEGQFLRTFFFCAKEPKLFNTKIEAQLSRNKLEKPLKYCEISNIFGHNKTYHAIRE